MLKNLPIFKNSRKKSEGMMEFLDHAFIIFSNKFCGDTFGPRYAWFHPMKQD